MDVEYNYLDWLWLQIDKIIELLSNLSFSGWEIDKDR